MRRGRGGGGGEGRCLQGNWWFSPPASMTSRLASATFKMASKVFLEETDTKFRIYHTYTVPISWIWRFWGPYCHRKLNFRLFWNETSSHCSHVWGSVPSKIEEFRHNNRRFIKELQRMFYTLHCAYFQLFRASGAPYLFFIFF